MSRITVDGLRQRREWLKQELAKVEREIDKRMGTGPAEQQPMQGMPAPAPPPAPGPRKPSVHEENHREFQDSRRVALVNANAPFEPDEANTVAYINVTMKRVRDACSSDEELFALFALFFKQETWAAKATPPYPWRALATDKVWKRLLSQLRGVSAAGVP